MRVIVQEPSFDVVEYEPAIRTLTGLYERETNQGSARLVEKAFKFPYILFVRRGHELHCQEYSYFACYYLSEPFSDFQTLVRPGFVVIKTPNEYHSYGITNGTGGVCLYGGSRESPQKHSRKPIAELVRQFWQSPVKIYDHCNRIDRTFDYELSSVMQGNLLKPFGHYLSLFFPGQHYFPETVVLQ